MNISDRKNGKKKTCQPGFRLGFGRNQNASLAGDSNPGGAPPRLGRVNGPVNGLSAGGLLEASCQKQGGREAVLYGHVHLVRLGHLSAK